MHLELLEGLVLLVSPVIKVCLALLELLASLVSLGLPVRQVKVVTKDNKEQLELVEQQVPLALPVPQALRVIKDS